MNPANRTELTIDGLSAVLFFDPLPSGGPLPAEIVVGPGGASRTLLRLTPRAHVSKVWDLGCGCGVQSVFAAQHSDLVIATDIDPRCLEFTAQSAAATGVTIETRLGSLNQPVIGETFELIIANPPFVIGGVTNLVHRESPLRADDLTRQLLEFIPQHLTTNGTAVLLCSWLETSEFDWQTRIGQWLPDNCDAWVGLRDSLAPSEYVDFWLLDAGRESDDIARSEWLERLVGWSANAVCFGWVVLQSTSGDAVHEIEDLRNAVAVPNGSEVLARMSAMRRANTLTAAEMLGTRFKATTSQSWRGDMTLDSILSAIRTYSDGETALAEIISQITIEFGFDEADVMIHALAGTKQLVNLGLLV